MRKKPLLSIVGAGPGDPELITLKGLRAIKQADVILYDALVSSQLLDFASNKCELVFVGKRKGKKEFSQEEINKLLVSYALRFNSVVRLKGGDPNVFGRGHEEFRCVSDYGIDVEIIPGISSALGGPTAAGIPLTKRGVSESFWVVTGTVSSGEISADLALAAQSSATIIVLMGFSKLREIATLIKMYRSWSEPMAIVQNATLPNQNVVRGTPDTVCQFAADANINSPAIIIIGKVVLEREPIELIKEHKLVSL